MYNGRSKRTLREIFTVAYYDDQKAYDKVHHHWMLIRAIARALIGGGGGGCLFMYSCYAQVDVMKEIYC